MKQTKTISFTQSGVYATDSRLLSIAEECLAAERRQRELDRQAKVDGATCGTFHI